VIADDLTGAQEMGALLASHGLRTVVAFHLNSLPEAAGAVVFDTESRHQPPREAARRVREAAELLARRLPPERVFKKIDSTMRGRVAEEAQALSHAFGGAPVRLTPAYPAFSRTVVGGVLLVNGIPVAETAFARDPLFPVRDSRVDALDASSDEDLERIAASPGTLLVGSGGLGRAWVRGLPDGSFNPSIPRALRPLLICGSAHRASRDQLRRALELGVPAVATPAKVGPPAAIHQALVDQALTAIRHHQPDLLIVFGGETAFGVLRALGVEMLWPLREVRPGIPVSLAGTGGREMMVVTKAGGFGEPADVDRILEQLT